jgi:uncharacterized protein YecE (DUF72 family)
LTDYLVGAGGWAYFKVPGVSALQAYSRVFNFVEVNSTYYEYPDPRMVEGWRRMVPRNFTFSVRCHRDLTHKIGLKPVDEAFAVLGRMVTYCTVLEAPFLVLETPATYELSPQRMKEAKSFFDSASLKGVRVVWEPRAHMTAEATGLMQDFDIVHSVDLSREMPVHTSDVVYSRLFGKGFKNLYQFTDEELMKIDQDISEIGGRVAALAYHGVRMYSDTARFSQYKKTGKFMPVTSFIGADSVRAVLAEDARFPSSRAELIKKQGWKVVDAAEDKRVHLSEFLLKLPDKTYNDLDEVAKAVEAVL